MSKLLYCGHEPSEHSECTTGYGSDSRGRRYCYDCCAERERDAMIKTGQGVLYLTDKGITDWPGRLVFKPYHRTKGRHNIARTREDVWFIGPDSKRWHGVLYGHNTQVVHCNRTKD